MAEQVYDLDLSLGFKTFRIRFADFNDEVEISFNPADADLPKRLFEAEKRIKESAKNMQNIEMNEDGTPVTDDYIEKMNAVNAMIFDAVDYAFGNKISDKVFKYCSPLAITGGKPFVVQFFEKITPVLEKIIKQEQAKSDKATQKYLAKYGK